MTTKKKQVNTGKHYEIRSHEIIGKVHPTESIAHNVRIQGRFSRDRKRQIDVKLGDYDFAVFECKDWNTKIGPETVGQAQTLFDDVAAEHGAVISNSGFTQGAINYAAAKGIDLLSIVDTEDPEIKPGLSTTLLIEDEWLRYWQCGIESQTNGQSISFPVDMNNQGLILPDGTKTTVYGLLRDEWNEGKLSSEEGWHELTIHKPQIETTTSDYVTVDKLQLRYGVVRQFSTLQLPIETAEGMYDVIKGTFRPTGNRFIFAPITLEDINEKAQPIDASEAKQAKKFGAVLGIRSLLPTEPPGHAIQSQTDI